MKSQIRLAELLDEAILSSFRERDIRGFYVDSRLMVSVANGTKDRSYERIKFMLGFWLNESLKINFNVLMEGKIDTSVKTDIIKQEGGANTYKITTQLPLSDGGTIVLYIIKKADKFPGETPEIATKRLIQEVSEEAQNNIKRFAEMVAAGQLSKASSLLVNGGFTRDSSKNPTPTTIEKKFEQTINPSSSALKKFSASAEKHKEETLEGIGEMFGIPNKSDIRNAFGLHDENDIPQFVTSFMATIVKKYPKWAELTTVEPTFSDIMYNMRDVRVNNGLAQFIIETYNISSNVMESAVRALAAIALLCAAAIKTADKHLELAKA
jgi:hypothetical protein